MTSHLQNAAHSADENRHFGVTIQTGRFGSQAAKGVIVQPLPGLALFYGWLGARLALHPPQHACSAAFNNLALPPLPNTHASFTITGPSSTTTHINTIPLPPLPASCGRRGSRPASDDLDTLLLESANGSPCPSTHSHVQPHPHAHGSHSSSSQHAQSSLEWSWERGGMLDVSGGHHGGHGTPQRAGSADTRQGEQGEFSLFAPSLKRGGAAAFFAPGWSWESTQDAPGFTWESWFTSERSLWTGVHAGEPRIAVPAAPPNRPGEPPCAHGPFVPVASFFAHAAPPDSRAVPLHTTFCPGVGRASEVAEGRGTEIRRHCRRAACTPRSLHPTRIRPLPGTAYSAQLSLPLPGKVSAPDFFPVAPALQMPAADARRRSEQEAHRDGVGLGLGEPDARRTVPNDDNSEIIPIPKPKGKFNIQEAMGLADDQREFTKLQAGVHVLAVEAKIDFDEPWSRQEPSTVAKLLRVSEQSV
ncbi:hypothetical protein B0H14DRAFT_3649135 [Mycena olivaceomarginata]|nr:hypothetical protein B0H14DRAFT_3649135 [Mycena olivaceomarginata]